MLKQFLWEVVMAGTLLIALFTPAVAERSDQSLTLAPGEYYRGLLTIDTEPAKINLDSGIYAIDVVITSQANKVLLSRLVSDKEFDPTLPRGRADVVEIDPSNGRLIRSIIRNDSPGVVGRLYRSADEDVVFVVWVSRADETVGRIERIDLRPEVPQTERIVWPPPGGTADCSVLRFEPTGDGSGFCVVSDRYSVRRAITPSARRGPLHDVYTWRTGAGWHFVRTVGPSPAYARYCGKFSRAEGRLDAYCREAYEFVDAVHISRPGHILLLGCDVREEAGPAILDGLEIDLIRERSTELFHVQTHAPVRDALAITLADGRHALVLRDVKESGPWDIRSENGALLGAFIPPQGLPSDGSLTPSPDGRQLFFFQANDETGTPRIDVLDLGTGKWFDRWTHTRSDSRIFNERFSFSNTLAVLLQWECREKLPNWLWGGGVSNRVVIWSVEKHLEHERVFQNGIAEEFAKHHDPQSSDLVPWCANFLKDVAEGPRERALAARVLGFIGDKRAIPQLRASASEDPDEAVRKAAQEALDRINARGGR